MANKTQMFVGAQLLRGFRLRWLVYGAAAYFALRLMSKNGIFAKQADAALDVIDRGIDNVKTQVGYNTSPTQDLSRDVSRMSHH